jgi:hypothetical protein
VKTGSRESKNACGRPLERMMVSPVQEHTIQPGTRQSSIPSFKARLASGTVWLSAAV